MNGRYRIPAGGHQKTHLPPLMTLKELAEQFGVSVYSLAALMRSDANAPKCIRRCATADTTKAYYVPAEVRKWWRDRGEHKPQAH